MTEAEEAQVIVKRLRTLASQEYLIYKRAAFEQAADFIARTRSRRKPRKPYLKQSQGLGGGV